MQLNGSISHGGLRRVSVQFIQHAELERYQLSATDQNLEKCRDPVHRLFAGYTPVLQQSSLRSLRGCTVIAGVTLRLQRFCSAFQRGLSAGAGPSLVKLVQLPFVVGSFQLWPSARAPCFDCGCCELTTFR
ncbi:hypothetical protein AVEN_140283-1 [Araneus ventricosus]|uniref:Uncharacterized protein n=1 Tax=Araneus ventricosus TaxID=182803 RepID=A0A4Y2X400_ARAVE|nr:hypothetical protein AVEN_79262-1 [Araneus ventricosus]GBO43615.1 hypothetical protein AVEN_105063-1 [Araneus ventricosus]GBO43617.1 hypothetical protein AVEN_179669-1 [Araneus ventricosus]GBO43690.1 hypothetical protein AVEN_140283-1 [Araneus ventricosus]